MNAAQLQQAAEALAQAAVEHSQSTNVALSTEALCELQAIATELKEATALGIQTKAELIRLNASSQATSAHVQGLQPTLNRLASDMAELKLMAVRQGLQWVMANSSIGSFTMCTYSRPTVGFPSDGLTCDVLATFMRGHGFVLDSCYALMPHYGAGPRNPSAEHHKAFRDRLSQQIHELTGVKPRIEKDGEDFVFWRV